MQTGRSALWARMRKGLQPALVQVHTDWADHTVGAYTRVIAAELPEMSAQDARKAECAGSAHKRQTKVRSEGQGARASATAQQAAELPKTNAMPQRGVG